MNSRLVKKIHLSKLFESELFLKYFSILGPLMYISFTVIDFVQYPNQQIEFMIVRILFCITVWITYYLHKNRTFFRNQLISCCWGALGSIGICYMLYRTDGPSSLYYNGINLIAAFSLVFSSFSKKFFLLVISLIYIPYYILCYLQFDSFVSWKTLIVYSAFNLGIIIVSLLTNIVRDNYLNKIATTELALEDELESREKIIKQKTEEATKLNQLSAQFSPQVVKAIKDGVISLDEGVKRAKICAIFIDIVRSTDKVTTLDENHIQLCLARFLDSCLTTFLKYDLTIDKFHGDGVLAFSNMPIQRPDFIERTCIAAFEATEIIKNDREFYLKYWQSEMQVRVGISVGYANVGFYGDKKFFKTFTAIGIPLPYASRLTSVAEPNQILVDSEIAQQLETSNFILKSIGQKTLKGFEGKDSLVYELIDLPASLHPHQESQTCPNHPDSVLYLDTNDLGQYVFKCRECDFIQSNTQQL